MLVVTGFTWKVFASLTKKVVAGLVVAVLTWKVIAGLSNNWLESRLKGSCAPR